MIIFALIILNFGPADGPTQILDILAFLSTFVMGAYCLTLAAVNRNHPAAEDPAQPDHHGGPRARRCGYLFALFYSLIRFGVTDLG